MRKMALAPVLLAALAACAPAGGKVQAISAATRFAAALARHDGSAACAVLSDAARTSLETGSGQSCPQAVLSVHSSSGSTRAQVWGDEAEVKVGTDTFFLDDTTHGWRVRAAGCKPQGADQPYECEVAA